ncbi:MAG TPA: metallophosphoesterase, partial [Roseiarcus sp.]
LNDMGLLKSLVEDLRAQRPDHVAVTGDLVNIGMPVEFQRAALWMETLGDPSDVSFVPGNHDAYVRASMPLLGTTFAPWATSDGAPKSKAAYPYLRVRGEIAIIGLSSAVPTAPLMATGRLGKKQVEAFAELLRQTGAKGLARVVLIHHPPFAGAPPLRGLSDAVAFERVIRDFGAEAILHGHIHRQAVRSLPSRAARTVGGAVPVLSAPSAAAVASHPRYRAAYHLVRLAREGERWRVSARSRGLTPESKAIGEREALGV